jgi:hypothetical protein
VSLFGNSNETVVKPNLDILGGMINRQISKIQTKFNDRYNYILERAKKDFSVVKSKFMEFLESID